MGVMTITGVVPKETLGITTPHEHALIDIRNQYPGDTTRGSLGFDGKVSPEYYALLREDPYALRDNLVLGDEECALRELGLFAKAGGRTFVDVTLREIGRDVRFLQRLAAQTGMHVVAATGHYTGDAHPAYVKEQTADQLADEMVRELTVGIDGTAVKAGIIGEIGTSFTITDEEWRVLKAAAIAHKATGAPIMVHLCPWVSHGLAVLDLLETEGVSLNRVCLCHTDILLDEAYMQRVRDRGAYLEFDNFGKEFPNGTAYGRFPTDEERLTVLYHLIDEGYLSKLLVSCDVCLKTLLASHDGGGYAYVLCNIAERIRKTRPDAQAILDAVLIHNPAAYLDNPCL